MPSILLKQWVLLTQVALSVLIILFLLWGSEHRALWDLLRNSVWNYVLLALVVKSITLGIREFRLWLALHAPRPSLLTTMLIGFVSGALHTLLPGRAGDLAAIGMLTKKCKITLSEATYAVGMAAFFEAAMFGILVCGSLGLNYTYWSSLIGEQRVLDTLSGVSLLTLGGIFIIILAAIIGRRFTTPEQPSNNGFSLKEFVADTFSQTTKGVTSLSYLSINIAVAALEVWLMVYAFSLGFPALGIELTDPWGCGALILGFSAFAAIALPPTYGAGPAAASLFVLSLVGVSEEQALAYAAIWWMISQLPATALGIPSLWLLRFTK